MSSPAAWPEEWPTRFQRHPDAQHPGFTLRAHVTDAGLLAILNHDGSRGRCYFSPESHYGRVSDVRSELTYWLLNEARRTDLAWSAGWWWENGALIVGWRDDYPSDHLYTFPDDDLAVLRRAERLTLERFPYDPAEDER